MMPLYIDFFYSFVNVFQYLAMQHTKSLKKNELVQCAIAYSFYVHLLQQEINNRIRLHSVHVLSSFSYIIIFFNIMIL